ncbi:hypothetical protein BJP62_01160 [Jeongeupia sp. USM3]|nr:hypothetical protein BJP62_01160 [Jeongeupia sp. USM3]
MPGFLLSGAHRSRVIAGLMDIGSSPADAGRAPVAPERMSRAGRGRSSAGVRPGLNPDEASVGDVHHRTT